jgi:hypothetical protein
MNIKGIEIYMYNSKERIVWINNSMSAYTEEREH